MGVHIQRKRFEALEMAIEARRAFNSPGYEIPGVDIWAEIAERDGEVWLVVIQKGDIVTGDEPLLPDYERLL